MSVGGCCAILSVVVASTRSTVAPKTGEVDRELAAKVDIVCGDRDDLAPVLQAFDHDLGVCRGWSGVALDRRLLELRALTLQSIAVRGHKLRARVAVALCDADSGTADRDGERNQPIATIGVAPGGRSQLDRPVTDKVLERRWEFGGRAVSGRCTSWGSVGGVDPAPDGLPHDAVTAAAAATVSSWIDLCTLSNPMGSRAGRCGLHCRSAQPST